MSVASHVMVEMVGLSAEIVYVVVKFPFVSVLIWLPFTVDPSQPTAGSVGRLSVVPPGSEHSMIWRPEGSADRTGKPVPVTVMGSWSLKGPVGITTCGPAAKACPGRAHITMQTTRSPSPA